MSDEQVAVELTAPAKVAGTVRKVGWVGRVNATVLAHLVEAGAVVKGAEQTAERRIGEAVRSLDGDLDAELKALTDRATAAEAKVISLTDQLAAMTADRDALSEQVATLTAEAASLTDQLAAATAQAATQQNTSGSPAADAEAQKQADAGAGAGTADAADDTAAKSAGSAKKI